MLIADDADEQQLRADIQEVFRTHPAGPFCVRITSAVSLSCHAWEAKRGHSPLPHLYG
jgi:hypothetical protein